MDFSFNISLGREVELYNRVKSNDPAASALVMLVLRHTGIEADEVLKDYDTVAAILAGTTDEATNTNYARKVLTDAELAAWTVDDTLNRILLSLPVQTFASIAAGDSWSKAVIAYDADTAAGTDANLIPITAHDLRIANAPIVPNGSNIVIDLSAGFVIAY